MEGGRLDEILDCSVEHVSVSATAADLFRFRERSARRSEEAWGSHRHDSLSNAALVGLAVGIGFLWRVIDQCETSRFGYAVNPFAGGDRLHYEPKSIWTKRHIAG